eukprot:5293791-Amphidinium_carterae.1
MKLNVMNLTTRPRIVRTLKRPLCKGENKTFPCESKNTIQETKSIPQKCPMHETYQTQRRVEKNRGHSDDRVQLRERGLLVFSNPKGMSTLRSTWTSVSPSMSLTPPAQQLAFLSLGESGTGRAGCAGKHSATTASNLSKTRS